MKPRPAPSEARVEVAVEHPRPGLKREVGTAASPAHRLSFREPLGDDLVDRAFYEAGRDALSSPVPLAIVDDAGRIAADKALAEIRAVLPAELHARALSRSAKIPFKVALYRDSLLWRIDELGHAALAAYDQPQHVAYEAPAGTVTQWLCGPANNEMMDKSHPRCHRPRHVQTATICTEP